LSSNAHHSLTAIRTYCSLFEKLRTTLTYLLLEKIMGEEQDFNSSDIEFGDAPSNPFANAGRASIKKILDNAVADRISSKKAVKQLTHVKGNIIFISTFL
jgi:hypothetical protein